MSAVDEILRSLPVADLAHQLDARPEEVQQAAAVALPALLGGLQANAADPAGAASIVEALSKHEGGPGEGPVDLGQVDTRDGEAIAQHIFGEQQGAVAQQLGGLQGVAGPLVQRLIPILAPIVMAWLARQVLGQAGAGGSMGLPQGQATGQGGATGSILTDILGSVLGRATGQGAQTPQTQTVPGQAPVQQDLPPQSEPGLDTGRIITQVLGGLLGGGRR
ncbi:DUF937 domain-containing protein [Arsenicicoccus dermatophilus]|uniref:DUF937 domain-containing protein n=1 Tax=Arsenicicoccus dermatophilus TaxID=1076331 RepID=UPI003916E754